MMNITDEMAATDANEVKATRTSVGWFFSPSCALIYQCSSNYVALQSSKGYAIGAKVRQWLDATLHGKEQESFNNELLGSIKDLLMAICCSRDYVFFIDAAVTERFSQTGSLRLEEAADLGAKAGGKLRNAILTGFGSDGNMAAVRAMALVCKFSLWTLLRAIGSDAHILDVVPTMWPT
eukprot:5839777-Pleurochrysis_carterae.AAC.1